MYCGHLDSNALISDCQYLRGLDAKRVISQKVKIEFLPVLCCHVVDSSTLSVVAQNVLSAALCGAELSDLWQNALSVVRKTWNFSECTKWI